MFPLPLLYVAMGGTGYLSSGHLQKGAVENNMQFSTLFGVETPKALGVMGLLGLVFGGPIIGAVGAGLALGSLEAWRNVTSLRDGIATYIQAKIAAAPGGGASQLPGSAPLQLPGPQPAAPAGLPQGSLQDLFAPSGG